VVAADGAARALPAPERAPAPLTPGEVLRFGVPRGGRIEAPAHEFLDGCGLRVRRESDRQLTATIAGLPGVTVILQRARDILTQVADGRVDVGITGLDIVHEHGVEGSDLVVLYPDLGFSYSELAVEVPDNWLDVSTLADLSDVAAALRERGQDLRVATSYLNLTRRFFYEKGITHFSLVPTEGGVEAAPTVGFADVVVDLVSTGVTLRQNHLKVLKNGVILSSQACLVGNRRALVASAQKREVTRQMVELMEARLRAQDYFSVTANLRGASEAEVARALLAAPATRGMRGPTVARVYTAGEAAEPGSAPGRAGDGGAEGTPWFAATIIVGASALLPAIDHLREVGGSGMSVVPVRYLFDERSHAFEAALQALGLGRD
jgi:ATP phosphoribosyltransferase